MLNSSCNRPGWTASVGCWSIRCGSLRSWRSWRSCCNGRCGRCSAAARYGALLAAMAIMVVVPLATWFCRGPPMPPRRRPARPARGTRECSPVATFSPPQRGNGTRRWRPARGIAGGTGAKPQAAPPRSEHAATGPVVLVVAW